MTFHVGVREAFQTKPVIARGVIAMMIFGSGTAATDGRNAGNEASGMRLASSMISTSARYPRADEPSGPTGTTRRRLPLTRRMADLDSSMTSGLRWGRGEMKGRAGSRAAVAWWTARATASGPHRGGGFGDV